MVTVGTRPEIIKVYSIIHWLKELDLNFVFVHSGQHYDYEMSLIFIEELGLPLPDYHIKLYYSSPADQMAELMRGINEPLKRESPSVLLVQGDTNTTLAAAIAANKLGIPIGHVEAGLRSYDWRMPEEFNRRLTDHLSLFLFAPTERARENLLRENVLGRIYVTGNTVIDAVLKFLPIAERRSNILSEIPFDEYILFTAHRAENVDDPWVLRNFVATLLESPLPVIYPLHPRTRKRLMEQKLWEKLRRKRHIKLFPPLGYFDFLVAMKHAKLIMTDSGGIVEEATAPNIRKPVLILRWSTERPEAIEAGFAKLVGVTKQNILRSLNEILKHYDEIMKNLPLKSPFGDGKAGERIVKIITKEIENFNSV